MRKMQIDRLKTRVGQAEYEIDAHAVAEAIVRRLASGGPAATRGAGASGAVLEPRQP
jgi:hypothetical protein